MARTHSSSGHYKFRNHDSLGANDAEADDKFLAKCFHDNGDLATILDTTCPKRIILGRTGSGKSALLLQIKRTQQHVITIEPECLSLNHISNSNVVRLLFELGINLDPFFKLLWRHVLAISLLQDRYHLVDEASTKASFLSQLFSSQENRKQRNDAVERQKKAIAYLERWGGSFWKDVDVRTKEITSHFESAVSEHFTSAAAPEVRQLLNDSTAAASANRGSLRDLLNGLSPHTKETVVHFAQDVVNQIQVKELTGMLAFLDEVLDDPSSPYYVTIDRLDENWVDERLRHRLLKALVDTVREFGKVHNAKALIALRSDLLESIFAETHTEAGFQEDKYRSLYVPLRWSKQQLMELLDQRVNSLVRDTYTTYSPKLADLLPKRVESAGDAFDYIVDRTWMRPRDVIEFFNACIRRAVGKASFTRQVIIDAEGEYSQSRKRSLVQEWYGLFPSLEMIIDRLFTQRTWQLRVSDIGDSSIDDICMDIVVLQEPRDCLLPIANGRITGVRSHAEARATIAYSLFRVGVVGLRVHASEQVRWADNEGYQLSPSEVNEGTSMFIHKGLWRALGIASREQQDGTC